MGEDGQAMLYNPPSGEAGATIALPNVRDDYPRPAVTYNQSSVFTPPTHQSGLPQGPRPQPLQAQVQAQHAQIPIDPSLLEMPAHPMVGGHQQMLQAPGANFHPDGTVSDYGGLQSAPMQSGWRPNPNSNRNANANGNNPNGNGPSPPDLTFSRSSMNTSGNELLSSPTSRAYYAANPNGPAPVGNVTTSGNPTLGGLNTTKSQSRLEVTLSQQSQAGSASVDKNGAGPSGTVDDSRDGLDYWTNDSYVMDGQSQAGPSTYVGAYDESN